MPLTTTALYDDAVALLSTWTATSAVAEGARRRALSLLTAGPVALTREHRPGHVTASALVVRPDREVLLCLHGKIGMWMQLGGHCEPTDHTLAGAALREAREESGIAELTVDPQPIDIDVHGVACRGPSFHFDVRFLVHCPAGAVEQVSAESAALGWFAADALPEPLAPGTVRQIAPALARQRVSRPRGGAS